MGRFPRRDGPCFFLSDARAGYGRRTSCDAPGRGFSPLPVHLTVHTLRPRYGASQCNAGPCPRPPPMAGADGRVQCVPGGRPAARATPKGMHPAPPLPVRRPFIFPSPSGRRRRKTSRFALAGESAKKYREPALILPYGRAGWACRHPAPSCAISRERRWQLGSWPILEHLCLSRDRAKSGVELRERIGE